VLFILVYCIEDEIAIKMLRKYDIYCIINKDNILYRGDNMNINCPDCGAYFEIDDTKLSSITSQIRDAEFEKEINKRLHEQLSGIEEKHKLEMSAKISETSLNTKEQYDAEIKRLQEELREKSETISKLSAESERHGTDTELAVLKAVSDVEKKRWKHKSPNMSQRFMINR
jgi:vacuolar-type H+-ATPase subunit I/STV1